MIEPRRTVNSISTDDQNQGVKQESTPAVSSKVPNLAQLSTPTTSKTGREGSTITGADSLISDDSSSDVSEASTSKTGITAPEGQAEPTLTGQQWLTDFQNSVAPFVKLSEDEKRYYSQVSDYLVQQGEDPTEFAESFLTANAIANATGLSRIEVVNNMDALSEFLLGTPAEKTFSWGKSLINSWFQGMRNVELMNLKDEYRGLFEAGFTDEDDIVKEKYAQIKAKEAEVSYQSDAAPHNWVVNQLNNVVQQVPYMLTGAAAGLAASIPASAAGLPGIAVTAAGIFGRYLVYSGQFGGDSFYNMKELGISTDTALKVSNYDRIINGINESALDALTGTAFYGATAGAVKGTLFTPILQKIAGAGTLGNAAASFGKYLIGQGGGEFVQEALESVTSAGLVRLAEEMEGKGYSQSTMDIISQAWEEGVAGFWVGAILGIPGAISATRTDVRKGILLRNRATMASSKEAFVKDPANRAILKSMGIGENSSDRGINQVLGGLWDNADDARLARLKGAQDIAAGNTDTKEAKKVLKSQQEVSRTGQGRIYSQIQNHEQVGGSRKMTVAFGDTIQQSEDKGSRPYAYIDVSIDDKNGKATIDNVTILPGYESSAAEIMRTMIENYLPDMDVSWEAEGGFMSSLKQSVINSNPAGAQSGLRFTITGERAAQLTAVKNEIKSAFKNITDSEAMASASILEALADSYDMSIDEFLKKYAGGGIIGTDSGVQGMLDSRDSRGAFKFIQGVKGVIYAGQKADISTFNHEMFHFAASINQERRANLNKAILNTLNSKGKNSLRNFMKEHWQIFASNDPLTEEERKAKGSEYTLDEAMEYLASLGEDGTWDRNAEEVVTSLYEAYLSDPRNKYVDSKLRHALSTLAYFIGKVYKAITAHTPLNQDIAKAFEEMMGLNGARIATQAEAQAEAESEARMQGNLSDAQLDEEYFKAIAEGDMDRVRDLVNNKAAEGGFDKTLPEQAASYTLRTKAAPKKTLKFYKVFYINPDTGKPSALFVEGKEDLPIGVWLDAKDQYHFTDPDNGLEYVPVHANENRSKYTISERTGKHLKNKKKTGEKHKIPNEKVYNELLAMGYINEGDTEVTALAYRPGWHSGKMPTSPQFGTGRGPERQKGMWNHEWNQVVYEIEVSADVDYNPEAQKTHDKDLEYLPVDGWYQFTTNPGERAKKSEDWIISGSIRIVRALSQDEVNEILTENNYPIQNWEQGVLDLDELKVTTEPLDESYFKTVAPITYDDQGNIIPLSQRFNPEINDIRFQGPKNNAIITAQRNREVFENGSYEAAASMGRTPGTEDSTLQLARDKGEEGSPEGMEGASPESFRRGAPDRNTYVVSGRMAQDSQAGYLSRYQDGSEYQSVQYTGTGSVLDNGGRGGLSETYGLVSESVSDRDDSGQGSSEAAGGSQESSRRGSSESFHELLRRAQYSPRWTIVSERVRHFLDGLNLNLDETTSTKINSVTFRSNFDGDLTPEEFYAAISAVAGERTEDGIARVNGRPVYGSLGANALTVDVHPLEDYYDYLLFLTPDKQTGFALHGNELVSVFSAAKGRFDSIMATAIAYGASKLDCYNIPTLMYTYQKWGFKPTGKVGYNPAYNADMEYAKANDGFKTPEYVVPMVYGGYDSFSLAKAISTGHRRESADGLTPLNHANAGEIVNSITDYGMDGYDTAMEARDNLWQDFYNQTNKPSAESFGYFNQSFLMNRFREQISNESALSATPLRVENMEVDPDNPLFSAEDPSYSIGLDSLIVKEGDEATIVGAYNSKGQLVNSIKTGKGKNAPSIPATNAERKRITARNVVTSFLKWLTGPWTRPMRDENGNLVYNKKGKLLTEEADGYYGPLPKREGETDEEYLSRAVRFIQDNLRAVWDSVVSPEDIRISREWYITANYLSKMLAEENNITNDQAAGILAVLSPRADWNDNVYCANVVCNALSASYHLRFTDEMIEASKSTYTENALAGMDFTQYAGKSFFDLDNAGRVAYIRGYYKYFMGDKVRIYNPKYGPMEYRDKGFAVQSEQNLTKAISIYFDGSKENIRKNLGGEMKVPAFFMNIVSPTAVTMPSTMDTMEVGISVLIPHIDAFTKTGITETKSDLVTMTRGIVSSNVLFYEAHSRLAEELGVLPCQIQSILWGKGQLMNALKGNKSDEITSRILEIWQKAGEVDTDEARSEAREAVLDILHDTLISEPSGLTDANRSRNSYFDVLDSARLSEDPAVQAEYERLITIRDHQIARSEGLLEYQDLIETDIPNAIEEYREIKSEIRFQGEKSEDRGKESQLEIGAQEDTSLSEDAEIKTEEGSGVLNAIEGEVRPDEFPAEEGTQNASDINLDDIVAQSNSEVPIGAMSGSDATRDAAFTSAIGSDDTLSQLLKIVSGQAEYFEPGIMDIIQQSSQRDLTPEEIDQVRAALTSAPRYYRDMIGRMTNRRDLRAQTSADNLPDIETRAEGIGRQYTDFGRRVRERIAQRLPEEYRQRFIDGDATLDSEIEQRLEQMDKEDEELRKKAEEVQKELDEANKRIITMKGVITRSKNRNAAKNKQIRELQAQLNRETKKVETREKWLSDYKKAVATRQEERRALQAEREYKMKLARSLFRNWNKNIDYRTVAPIMAEIRSKVTPRFARNWLYDPISNPEGNKGGETITFDELRSLYESDQLTEEARNIIGTAMWNRLSGEGAKPLQDWTVAELEELNNKLNDAWLRGRAIQEARNEAKRTRRAVAVEGIVDSLKSTSQYKKNADTRIISSEEDKHVSGWTRFTRVRYALQRMQEHALKLDGDTGARGENWNQLIDRVRRAKDVERRAVERRMMAVSQAIQAYDARHGKNAFVNAMFNTTYTVDLGDVTREFTASTLAYAYLANENEKAKAAVMYGNLIDQNERSHLGDDALVALGEARFNHLFSGALNVLLDTDLMSVVEAISADLRNPENGQRLLDMSLDLFNTPVVLEANYLPVRRQDVLGDEVSSPQDLSMVTGNYIAKAKDGFLKEKVTISPRHQTAVRMDLMGVWTDSVKQQEHLIANAELLSDLNAIYERNRQVTDAIRRAWGNEMMTEINDYLQYVADPDYADVKNDAGRVLRWLRGSVSTAYLGFKLSSIITQLITSPAPFVGETSMGNLAAAFINVTAHPTKTWEFVSTKSTMMKYRSANMIIQEISDEARRPVQGKVSRVHNRVNEIGMKGLEWVDRYTVSAGWLAKYNDVLQRELSNGADTDAAEQTAISAADEMVLRTQPTGDKTEVARLFRTNQTALKMLLQFQSAMNVVFNNLSADLRYDFKQAGTDSQAFKRVIGHITGYALSGILLGMIQDGFGDDDDDENRRPLPLRFVNWGLSQGIESVPFIGGDLGNFATQVLTGESSYYTSSSYPTASGLMTGLGQLATAFDRDDPWEAVRKGAVNVGYGLGMAIGLPTSSIKQVGRSIIAIQEDGLFAGLWPILGRY